MRTPAAPVAAVTRGVLGLGALCLLGVISLALAASEPLMTLLAASMKSDEFRAEDFRASLDWQEQTPVLRLAFKSLVIQSVPGFRLERGELRCRLRMPASGRYLCEDGRASFSGALFAANQARFRLLFDTRADLLELEFRELGITSGGMVRKFSLTSVGAQWSAEAAAEQLDLAVLNQLPFVSAGVQLPSGKIDLAGNASGAGTALQNIDLKIAGRQIQGEYAEGRLAFEGGALRTRVYGQYLNDDSWQGALQVTIDRGATYLEPVFLQLEEHPLTLALQGSIDLSARRVDITRASLVQRGVVDVDATAELALPRSLSSFSGSIRSPDLGRFFQLYATPFLYGSSLGNIQVSGRGTLDVSFDHGKLNGFAVNLASLSALDPTQRLSIEGMFARAEWKAGHEGNGYLGWERASIYRIPLGPMTLPVSFNPAQLSLRRAVHMKLLGGLLSVSGFRGDWSKPAQPALELKAQLKSLSLEQLSTAMGWMPLKGNISGNIPGISYRQGTVALEGRLGIEVFDGRFEVDELQVSELFGSLPRMTGSILMENLDLAALTDHFSIGHIEGRLDGRLSGLELENWKPVAFDAWLGTPPDDKSRHIISQKAVENLTSLGGGSAVDVLSRGVMRLFDRFGYERIGLGCRLANGICQLNGVSPADQGYYIVKGSGVPTINVIGYNRQVDWPVLLERLERITHTNRAVVE